MKLASILMVWRAPLLSEDDRPRERGDRHEHIEALEHQSRECVHTPALHMILIATPAREVLAPQKVGDREYRLPWDRQQTVPPRNALEFGERALGFVEVFEYLGADDEV